MWRIGIAGIVLVWGAIAGGLVISEAGGGARLQAREVAARQVPAIASDVDTAAGIIPGYDRVPLAQSMHDQLRRELFGAAASSRQPRQANEEGNDPPAAAPARDPDTGAGATGDIPASMTASLPPAAETAPAADGRRPHAATAAPPATAATAPKADPTRQVPPAPPQPRAEAAKPAQMAPRASASARAGAPPPAAAKGTAGDPKVAEAQRLLAILGYAPGAADGRPGKQTAAAVLAYERAAGLPVDGRIDTALLTRLRKDMRSPGTGTRPAPSAQATRPASLTERILGGMQRLIGRDLDSVRAPQQLAEYCRSRADEWIYDRGQDRLRHCGDINGGGRIAYRPLPGDR